MDICSETDSTNECSDFKSELDDEEEQVGASNAGGQHAGPSRKGSGLNKRTGRHPRVVFV